MNDNSEPVPSPAPTNCDPWNWGWDESNNNKTMSDKNTDPAWDWPAEDTTLVTNTTYHTETHDFVPMYGYTDNTSAPQGYTPVPGQVSQHGYIGQPGSYVFQQPQHYDHIETVNKSTKYDSQAITHQGAVETAGNRTNHDSRYVSQAIPHQGAVEIAGSRTNHNFRYDSQAITHQGAVETAGNRTNHDSRYVSQPITHKGAVETAGNRTNHDSRYVSQPITHKGAVETAGNRTNHDSRYVSQAIPHQGAVEIAGIRTNHDSRYDSQAITHQGAVETAGSRTNHDSSYDSQAITHQGAVETAGSKTNHDSRYESQAITHQGAVETAGNRTNHDSRYVSQAITHQGAVETAGNRTNHDSSYDSQAITHQGAVETAGSKTDHDSRYDSQAITHQGAVETAGSRTDHDSRYESQGITHQGAVETAGSRTNHDSSYDSQAITHQGAVETAGNRTNHDSRYESQAITHQGAVETAGNRTNHDSRYESQAITHQGAVETAGSRTNHDTTQTDDGRLDVIKPEVQTYSPLSYESQGNVTYDTDLHVRYTSLEQAIDAAECEGEPAPPGSTIDLQEGLIVSRGPEGLPSQWSTESLPSQGSDGNQSDVSQQQDSRAYQYGAYEYHPDQTVGPPQLVYSPELSAMKQDTHRHPPLKANPSSETVFHNNSSFAVDAEQYKVEDKNPLERSSIQHYQEHGPQDSSGHWYPRHWTHDQGISDQEYQIRGHSTQGTSVMHRPISHPQEIGPHQYTPQDQGPQETSVQQHSSNHQELEVRPQQYMPQGQGPLETSVQQHSSNHQELEVRPQQYMPQGQGPLETSAQQHPLSHPCQELEMRHEELTPKGQGSQETGGHHFPSSDQDPNIRSRQRQGLQEASDMGAIFLQSDLGEPQFETRVNRQEAMSHPRGTKMGYVENEEIVPPEKANVVVVSQSHSPEDINTLTDEGNTNTTTHLGEVSTPQGVCLGLTPAADVNPIVPSPSSDVKQGPPPPGDVRQGTSPTGETTNPYKLGLSSHKHTNRFFHSPAQFLDPGVNLETVPDNKEHPDCVEHSAVERRNTSPLVRHTEPVGQIRMLSQDATVPLLHWPQQTPSYSASPENMEVAPRCGPDRNQYLETGQLTEEEPPSFQRLVAGGAEDTKRDEVLPPPGLRRMVPGESSSPESSANVFQPIEPRVVTGVDTQPAPSPVQACNYYCENFQVVKKIIDSFNSNEATSIKVVQELLSDPEITIPRIKSECSSPVPETTKALPQPPSERSETIGSDNVDLFQPTSAAIADNHRENIGRREEPEERDVVVPTRRRGDYYNPREREGDDSPGRENRGQYEVVGDLRGSPQSSGRYRDDPQRDVRRSTRSKRSYNRVDDEDEDTEEYYSDRDRVGRRDKPAYRDDYDHRYKGRAERNREKPQHRGHDKLSPRDRQERLVHYNTDMARSQYTTSQTWQGVSTLHHRHGKESVHYNTDMARSRYTTTQTWQGVGTLQHRHGKESVHYNTGMARSQYTTTQAWQGVSTLQHRHGKESAQYNTGMARSQLSTTQGWQGVSTLQHRDGKESVHYNTGMARSQLSTTQTWQGVSTVQHRHGKESVHYNTDMARSQYSTLWYSVIVEYWMKKKLMLSSIQLDDYSGVPARDRDRRRDPRQDYYSREYEDNPYYREQRSRPSSRSRPEYDDYRVRDYHAYSGYNYYGRQIQGYPYSAYYGYDLKYLEDLRRTNPVLYAEYYAKYLSPQAVAQGSYTEDRGSVHSGRSSANEERYLKMAHYQANDYYRSSPLLADCDVRRGLDHTNSSGAGEPGSSTPQQLTPAKFSTAHVKGVMTARGQLLRVMPHYPLDGQSATVEIHDMQALPGLEDTRQELRDFPGPLVRASSSKNYLINFCTRKIKSAGKDPGLFDRGSVILLWRLLVVLLKQNGSIVGQDIAELLLSERSESKTSSHGSHDAEETITNTATGPIKSEEELTGHFRELLLYGNTKEALEWAMSQGLWGHALFLASKMDARTHANVMMRFANGLTMNDPLQTLYQLMSGRQPAAVTWNLLDDTTFLISDIGNWLNDTIVLNSDIENWLNDITVLNSDSGNWLNDITVLNSDSGNWLNDTTVLNSDSGNWLNDTTVLNSDSGNWLNDTTVLNSDSGNWLNDTTVLNFDSGNWLDDTTVLNSDSGNWLNDTTVLNSDSGNWLNDTTVLNSDSGNWLNDTTFLNSDSGNWLNDTTFLNSDNEKWGDWRPHLAMILSNCSQRPDLLRRAVIILGDTLGARGCLHAAHFCYLMAQHEFGTYAHKSSKIVLIGSSHLKPFNEFATNEAIQMTEIYLYASRLGDENFNLPQFQPYKLLYAQRLSEHGFTSEAAHYSEELAGTILKHPGQYPATFLRQVYDLGDRLRYHDPLYSSAENQRDPQWLTALEAVITDYRAGVLRSDNPDHGSTSNLSYSPATTHEPPPLQETSQYTETPYTDWQTQGNNDFYNRQQHHNNTEVAWYGQESQFTPEQSQFTPEQSQFTPEQSQFTPEQSQFTPEQSQFTPEQSQFTPEQSQFTPDQSQFTPEQSSQYSWRQDPQTSTPLTDWSQSGLSHQSDSVSTHRPNTRKQHQALLPMFLPPSWSYRDNQASHITNLQLVCYSSSRHDSAGVPRHLKTSFIGGTKPLVFGGTYPIDMPLGRRPLQTFDIDVPCDRSTAVGLHKRQSENVLCSSQTPADDIEEHKPVSLSTSAPSHAKPKKESQRSKPSTAASNGWFGGLWNKIALRPKNQMKLPDDKNPSIVWDSDNKRWTNLDNDQEEEAGAPPPPPKMSELPRPTVAMAPVRGVEPQVDSSVLPSSNNIYKMNKTRSLRASYVDVLGGSKAANPLVSAPDLFPTMVAPRSNINLFVPAAVERSDEASSDFLTPASGGGESQDSASDPSQLYCKWRYLSSNSTVNGGTCPLAPEKGGTCPLALHSEVRYLSPSSSQRRENVTYVCCSPFPLALQNNLSRWSSASSLSREVESYTSRASRHRQQGTAFPEPQPFMFDPSSFNQTTSSWAPSNQPHLT
uniref:Sec16 Sec23-binding domain-containing protein n=1 Tax=Timema tahoe TaxID=61484 RepID=A0A7R9FN53_9NEOP|nr:unnamed protein product [Timema tahoe]